MKYFHSLFIYILSIFTLNAASGYDLWLNYKPLDQNTIDSKYSFIKSCHVFSSVENDVVSDNAKNILLSNLSKLLGKKVVSKDISKVNQIALKINPAISNVNDDGFQIQSTSNYLTIEAKSNVGLLYGIFKLLGKIHRSENIKNLNFTDSPKVRLRVLNHWDNIDRTVERGYAGFSIFNWHELPEVIEQRYEDYAMANASIGINGTVLTNVNANAIALRSDYLDKAAALAHVFRKFGIKVYLTARFSAPIELGGLKTADPLDPQVRKWWSDKIDEIYTKIPDFGGFLVKANSEGQPGPQDYQRNHADGANMLAKPLKKYNGIVMWRAFVYSHETNVDRFKQAFNEFVPLDGKFDDNVIVQVKNGPIDFQPREPIHPLFGAMPKTPLMLELQITKEYLGQGTHLVGLANMYKEILQTDIYAIGKGSSVAKIIDGSLHGYQTTGLAGVANIGTALNWTGNLFAQADWYAFGKLAWNPYLNSDEIFDEWSKSTFPKDKKLQKTVVSLLDVSHEACVNYMTPLGLHHIMAEGHHYGPGPWVDSLPRADWTAVYYHKANVDGIGFDRTLSGNAAVSQYNLELANIYGNLDTCPDELLLWFHRVRWDHKLKTGLTVWEALIQKYDLGVATVDTMYGKWKTVKGLLDSERYQSVMSHLAIQKREAKWWRDACLAYFQSKNGLAYPKGIIAPEHDVTYYKNLSFPYAPGIKPKW